MNSLMRNMMLSCEKATLLIERKADGDITVLQRMQLVLHTSMCRACTNYQKQTVLIDKLLGKYIKNEEARVMSDIDTTLLKAAIKAHIHKM